MAKFPPNSWEVRPVEDFEILTVPAPTGSRYHLQDTVDTKLCTMHSWAIGQLVFKPTGLKDSWSWAKGRLFIDNWAIGQLILNYALEAEL